MPMRNIYHLSFLPTLGDLGSAPPISPGDLLECLADAPEPRRLVEAVLVEDDLRQREALLAGEIEQVAPAVLREAQVRDQEALPSFLAVEGEQDQPPGEAHLRVDAGWAAYYGHMAGMARPGGFLAGWLAFEVGLRNALAAARAKALGLEAERYLVAAHLGLGEDQYAAVVSEWAAAPTPLAGHKLIDQARWEWLVGHDGWFTYTHDELAAYAVKLMLLHRWKRIAAAGAG